MLDAFKNEGFKAIRFKLRQEGADYLFTLAVEVGSIVADRVQGVSCWRWCFGHDMAFYRNVGEDGSCAS